MIPVSAYTSVNRTQADGQSKLDKFVLISWCGDGVPEFKKGLYRELEPSFILVKLTIDTQSSQVASKFLKGAHLVLQARSDVCDYSST